MMTKRSNHMPMFTKIDRMKIIQGVVRTFRIQNSCGMTTLQVTMDQ